MNRNGIKLSVLMVGLRFALTGCGNTVSESQIEVF